MKLVPALVVALVGIAALPACDATHCGPGTQQEQQPNGSVECVPVAGLPDSVNCDVDGGATIVGGHCVSAISCGANTMLDPATGQCESTGGGGGGGVPTCSNPTSGNACINGALLNFLDSTPFTGTIHVAIYNPIDLLSGGPPLDKGDFMGGGYIFPNVPAPSLGLIGIVVGDADRMNTTFVNCATGDTMVSNGNKYHVDAYALPRSVTDGWKAASGFDIATGGAYVAKFYSDTKATPALQIANEKSPVMGVQLTQDGSVPAGVAYFDSSLASISGTLTATSSVGAAIVAAPTSGAFPTFSGSGPSGMPITWEAQPGGSAAGLVFVTRFHPN